MRTIVINIIFFLLGLIPFGVFAQPGRPPDPDCPIKFNISGGGNFCAGGSGVTITLSGSQSSIVYQLKVGGTDTGSPLSGTGAPLTWNNITTSGVYTVSAQFSNCTQLMNGLVTVTQVTTPTVFSTGGSGSFCPAGPGATVTLSGSEAGVNYQLMDGTASIGSSLAGTGTALSWSGLTTQGTLTILATAAASGCVKIMNGNAPLTSSITTFSVAGGGTICAGATGPTITLSGSQSGVRYQLMMEGSPIGSAKSGTGSSLNWTNNSASGVYTVIANKGSTPTCTLTMAGSATVTLNPLPVIQTVSGGGSMCNGGAGLTITLSNSNVGVNYQLKIGSTNIGTAMAGTGAALAWINNTTAGTYTVVATNATTSCMAIMSGNAVIVVNALPTAYKVSGSGNYCAEGTGRTIILNGSQIGVNYQLLASGATYGVQMMGSGGALNWANVTGAATYTVLATNAATSCVRTMTGSAVLTVIPLPTVFNVTGGGTICSGAAGLTISLSGSQTGVNYQLKNGNTNVGSVKAGTNDALTWSRNKTAGTYTIVALNSTNSTCTQLMSSNAVINVDPIPLLATVSGSGTICSGDPGLTISLSGSETGINYQLKRSTTTIGSPVAGTGSPLSWTGNATAGTYTIVAINATTSCTVNMTGNAVVTVNPLPTAYTVGMGGTFCEDGAGVSITLSGSQTGINYQLNIDGVAAGTVRPGTGSALTWPGNLVAGTYTITGINAITNCVRLMKGSKNVVVNPLPTAFNISGGNVCAPSSITPSLPGSQTGVNYQLLINGTNSGSAKAGTGSALTWTELSTVGTYTILATNATTKCSRVMTGTASVNTLPFVYAVTGSGNVCIGSSGLTVSLNGSQIGVNYQLKINGTSSGSPVAGTGSALEWTSLASAGTYNVEAVNATSLCTSTMSGNAVITVNPLPGLYNVTGGGTLCTAPGTSAVISLSGSSTGISYRLKVNNVNTGTTISGTGSGLSWNDQNIAGIYTVVATNIATGCMQTMNGTAVIVADPVCSSLDNWSFQYKYDGRKRMTHKKVPGADWVFMVYDDRDRLVLTQDGNQRLVNQWLFTKYDTLNRQVVTGTYTHRTSIDQKTMAALISKTKFCEKFNNDAYQYGYTNNVWPTDNLNYLTITYYDDYNFNNDDKSFAYVHELTGQPATSFNALTKTTGSLVKVLASESYWLKTIVYYDEKGRVVQTTADHGRSGIERTTNQYDFIGKVLKTKTTHSDNRASWTDLDYTDVKKDRLQQLGDHSYGEAGAASVEMLAAGTDGWVEATACSNSAIGIIGFSSVRRTTGTLPFDFSFFMQGDAATGTNHITAFETEGHNFSRYGIRTGDKLRVERKGTAIIYKLNGFPIYISAYTSSGALYVNTSTGAQSSMVYQPRTSFTVKLDSVTRRFEYDHAGRLVNTFHKVQNNTEVLLVKNEYNELGQLVDKNLHSTDNGSTFKQSVDYRYNIRGWLTSINNSQLTNNGTTNNDTGDLFGMELGYNNSIGTSNDSLFNGNISAMKWSNNLAMGTVKDVGYNYSYDPMNRILTASYKMNAIEGWNNTSDAFSESNYSYDQNGNILSLDRKASNGSTMDVLTYNYGSGPTESNKLLMVSDAGDKANGFIEPTSGSGNDYAYDANGNMTVDNNKNLSGIYYNHLNLPSYIIKNTGEELLYVYDGTGRKLSQEYFKEGQTLRKVTDYSGEYFYENDTLKFINHEEGRIVMTGGVPEYQYHLKDHLGNVRTTFTSKAETETNTATLESANYVTEYSQFISLGLARRINARIFDHTHKTSGGAETTSVRLSGGENEKIGLAKSLSVMPGDKIEIEVFAKFVNGSGNDQSLMDALAAIAGTVGGSVAGAVIDGAGYATASTVDYPFIGLGRTGTENTGGPKAYLNYYLFDRNHAPITGGFKRLSSSARETGGTGGLTNEGSSHERLFFEGNDIIIKEPGYVYIWLSNEEASPVEVYFDDFKVKHVKTPVVQTDDYYPFGLTFNSYQRENSVANKFQYNGKEMQDELNLGWLDYGARMYMPEIGRWGVVDRKSEKYFRCSLYNYAINNPLIIIDPDGNDIYRINQESGELEITKTKAKRHQYYLVGANNKQTYVGSFKVNNKGLIQLPSSFSAKDGNGNSFGFNVKDGSESRSFISGNAMGSLLGALAETGTEDLTINGFSKSNGASPKPSLSHKKGKNGDLRYLSENKNGESVVLDDGNLDLSRQNKLNDALFKFGWTDMISEKLSNNTLLNHTSSAKDRKIPTDHSNHLHLQGYNPKVSEIYNGGELQSVTITPDKN